MLPLLAALGCSDEGSTARVDATGDAAKPSDGGPDQRSDAGDQGPLHDADPRDGARDLATTDSVPTDSATDTTPSGPMIIHFKKPSGWPAAHIHYWQTWPSKQQTSWPGPAMTDAGGGWYSFELPNEQSAGIVFNDGGSGQQTIDLYRVGSGHFVPTGATSGKLANGQSAQVKVIGRWTTENPDTSPILRAYPAGGVFYGNTLSVELEAEGAGVTVRRYTTDGSDPASGGQSFTDGMSITLGSAVAAGQSVTLRLFASTASGQSSRSFVFKKKPAVTVEAWKPANKPASSTKNGRWVSLKDFNNDQGLGSRNVTIYLPADYATKSQRRYRVVYFHDGQNLFQPQEATFGQEWMVDEAYDELIAEDLIDPAIFVGIWSATDSATRTMEYVGGCGVGDGKAQYAAWLMHSLKPYIDEHYRTRPEVEFTTTMGSSYGGIISYYLSWNHPDVFSGAACVSTAFGCNGVQMLSDLLAYAGAKKNVRYWIDGGFAEGSNLPTGRTSYVQNNRLFAEKLAALGWRENDDLGFLEAVGEGHSETAWSHRIKQILYFLLRRETPRIAHVETRTALDKVAVGKTTYASIDVRYENGPLLTKVFADSSKPASFQATPATAITVSTQDGLVTAKAPGTVTLVGSYQGFIASTSLEFQ